ncbi:MAG: SHOCT domain-containing protein [Thermoleophilia bacterium]
MMGWNGWGGSGVGGIFSLIFMAGFWILVVVGIVLVVRALTGPRHDAGTPQPHAYPPQMPMAPPYGPPPAAVTPAGAEALRILEERYARGDIEREEFLQRKADLSG